MIPDPKRNEMIAAAILATCREVGATRREVVTAALSVGVNHALVTDVASHQCQNMIDALYAYRTEVVGVPDSAVVPPEQR